MVKLMIDKSNMAKEIVTKLSETYKLDSGLSKMVKKAIQTKLTKAALSGLWVMVTTTIGK